MASVALAFDILARDRSASRTFNQVGDSAERAGKKGSNFGKAMKGAVGVAAGAIAAAGIGNLIRDSFAEANEAQKVGATTAQIIKSTGGAANVSRGQVESLAGAISEKVGVDDEAIQSGANLLLTFKRVRNEVGAGNAVFDRATAAAVDLSAAGFGSVESASKTLGKALNDPVKGVSALSRAGVTFTQQQKDQIKTLTESGRTLDAQKIILAEVESQVGGVAAASATTSEKLTVAFGNIKESIGTALLPVLDKLGVWFLEKGLPAIQRFGGWISDKLWPALQKGYQTILPGIQEALGIVTGSVGDGTVSWEKIGAVITDKVIPFMATLIRVYLPQLARNIRVGIEVVKMLWQGFETWRTVVGTVVSFILKRFADLADTWATVLTTLGKVPGFEWATKAGEKMQAAADKARGIATAIDSIDSEKDVNVRVNFKPQQGRIQVGDQYLNVGLREKGGPVRKGEPYIVGERRPELFIPEEDGRIIPRLPTGNAVAAQGGSVGGTVDLSMATLVKLVELLRNHPMVANISTSQVAKAVLP